MDADIQVKRGHQRAVAVLFKNFRFLKNVLYIIALE